MQLGAPSTLSGSLRALVEEFRGVFPASTVEQVLTDSHVRLQPARVEAFLPLLAQRFARERLRAASRPAPGPVPTEARPALVLFVCGANSGRSQIAAAALAQQAAGRVEASSAGTSPSGEVQPEVVQVLAEMGVASEHLFPKPITPEVAGAADVVVTMGCTELVDIPDSPRRYLDWDVDDPAGRDLAEVRRIRDELAARVEALVDELIAGTARPPRR